MADELMNEFINESREHLATIETDLLTIEEGGVNVAEELVNKVFRAAHSIKGGSAFFGLTRVKELAHKVETVLDMLRAGKMTPNAEITNVLLAAFDKLREMINNPGAQGQTDIADLVVALSGLASSYLPPNQKASLTQHVTLHCPGDENFTVTLPQVDFERAQRSGQFVYCVDLDLIHDIERKGKNVLAVFRDIWETGEILDCNLDFEAVGTLDGPLGNQLLLRLTFATIIRPAEIDALIEVSREKVKVLFDPTQAPLRPMIPHEELVPPPPEPPQACPPEPVTATRDVHPPAPKPGLTVEPPPVETQSPSQSSDSTLRVNVGLLESLMNLAGELVLSRNQLRAAIATKDVQALNVADQRFNLVTSELQEAIMRTRLQPIGSVFAKFPRVVRDMANALHKDILLDIQGKDVALDRSLIEGLSDPLTHMVRNAVDHGIETPDIRLGAGKKGQGTIRIEARHEAGQVVVEISDDGKGIDPATVAQAALDKGLITPEKLGSMSVQDKMALVLLPGLSTAKIVTDLSGRGVGMDVVKTNLDRLGGKIEITSEIGKGSLFRIKLPLTLAIIPSLIISVGKERFAIPQINVEELLQIRPEEVKKRIETVGGAQVLLLRDKILPLVYMDRLLGVASAGPDSNGNGQVQTPAPLEIAVVTTGAMAYGLVVSTFHETEEIVVKPLGRHLKGLGEYAGATILGDGAVALILDIAGVAAKAEFTAATGAARGQELADEAERTRLEETHSLLLFQNAPGEVCAIPLEAVLRIERTTPERVEMVGSRRTIQYRGVSLPLVTLSDAARVSPLGETRDLAVIVASVRGREVGLLGAMPVDVVETKTMIDQTTHRQTGIAGSAIIRDKTTLIADLFELVDIVYPEWKQVQQPLLPTTDGPAPSGSSVLLLAEDSDFFRAQIKKYLEQDGYTVLEAPDGQAAWELLLDHVQEVSAVVTDIEMPRLTGLELTQLIRSDARLGQLPVIALSSLAADEDIARSKAAGANEHLVKLDRDMLLSTIHAFTAKN